MMKRILHVLVALLMAGQLLAQPGREDVLLTREQRQQIVIAPEMAKGLLLWAEVKNSDSIHCSEGVYYDCKGNVVLKGPWGVAAGKQTQCGFGTGRLE